MNGIFTQHKLPMVITGPMTHRIVAKLLEDQIMPLGSLFLLHRNNHTGTSKPVVSNMKSWLNSSPFCYGEYSQTGRYHPVFRELFKKPA